MRQMQPCGCIVTRESRTCPVGLRSDDTGAKNIATHTGGSTHRFDGEPTLNKLKRNTVCVVTYRCRDIGYGVERGSVRAYWTGEVDVWGKLTVRVVSGRRRMLYLFPDEIRRVRANVLV